MSTVRLPRSFSRTPLVRTVVLALPVATTRRPTLERLAASGWVVLGSGENLADLGPPLARGDGPSASEILEELRKDDR
jgi:hypothetical protein